MKATNTSPLTKEVEGKVLKLKRKFLGELFPTCTKESNELKAYVKGHDTFSHGRELVRTQNGLPFYTPKQHDVRQEYFYQ